jgi:hypothetical protein
MIVLDLSILNQKGTPMFNSDLTANRPTAGIVGRIFIAIDSPYGIFRDTGTAWDQISSSGGADTNIYNTDGTLTGTRTVSSGGFQLVFNPQTTFFSSLTASTGASSFSVLGSNSLTFAAAFSSSNIGNLYGANGAINSQTFLGNATFAQANLASAMVNVNKITLDSGGHTITMTQSTAPGIRAMTAVQNQIQYTGTHNGTITHAAISQNLGFFRDTGAIRTLTITNAYSLLLNPLDDYGSGFNFTNRWGIYQAGASDKNYFAANSLFGTTTDGGQRVQISQTTITLGTQSTYPLLIGSGSDTMTLASRYIQSWNGLNLFLNSQGNGVVIGSTSTTTYALFVSGITHISSNTLIGTSVNAGYLLDVNGTARVSDNLIVSKNQSLTTNITISNTNSGSSVQCALYLANNLSSLAGAIIKNSSTTSAYKILGSGDLCIYNDSVANNGDISILNDRPAGVIKFAAGGSSTAQLQIETTGKVSYAAATTAKAQINLASGTAPTSPVNGDIWFDGTNLFMQIGGLTKTFTII